MKPDPLEYLQDLGIVHKDMKEFSMVFKNKRTSKMETCDLVKLLEDYASGVLTRYKHDVLGRVLARTKHVSEYTNALSRNDINRIL